MEQFQLEYPMLNPYLIGPKRSSEVIMRKPGSVMGQALQLEELKDCEIYICDKVDQVLVDYLERCVVMLGPCESSAFIRNCVNCVFWIAAQQLRTRDCINCTFYLYSKTYPIIEKSEGLIMAPWTARYPHCEQHFEQAGFDTSCNFWNAVFDFNGVEGKSNWSICPCEELLELVVELDESPELTAEPSNPLPKVDHALLCAEPLEMKEGAGEGLSIPQTRPPLPVPPSKLAPMRRLATCDAAFAPENVGIGRMPRGLNKWIVALHKLKTVALSEYREKHAA